MRGIGVAVITSRCGGRSAFCGEHQPLGDAEAMLLVDHREAEILVGDRLLEDRVGADQDVDRAVGEAHQGRFAHPALLAPGQDRDIDRQAGEHARVSVVVMLAREDLGRREQRRPARPPRPRSASPSARPGSCPSRHRPGAAAASARPAARSPSISRDRAALRAGRRIGQLAARRAAGRRPSAARPRRRRDEARTSISASWLANSSS